MPMWFEFTLFKTSIYLLNIICFNAWSAGVRFVSVSIFSFHNLQRRIHYTTSIAIYTCLYQFNAFVTSICSLYLILAILKSFPRFPLYLIASRWFFTPRQGPKRQHQQRVKLERIRARPRSPCRNPWPEQDCFYSDSCPLVLLCLIVLLWGGDFELLHGKILQQVSCDAQWTCISSCLL